VFESILNNETFSVKHVAKILIPYNY